jgi:acyl dehydratase
MRSDLKNQVLLKASLTAHPVKLEELAQALGSTPTAALTASIGLFFGPTVVGYRRFVDAIHLDLDRALLGGHEATWTRPFVANEPVEASMTMLDHTMKGAMEFGVFETTFSTPAGELIQTQRTTFIERPPKA